MRRFFSALARILLPIGILAAGGYGFMVLSIEPEEEKAAPPAKQFIRTKVTTLTPGDYTVIVRTNGVIQSHNLVTLSAEVAGEIKKVNAEFEVGSYFEKGDVLIELDDRDYQTALSVARARKQLAESSLRLAEAGHRRISRLSQSNTASKSQLDEAVASLAQARAQLDIADSQIAQAERDLQRTIIRAPFGGRVQQKLIGIGQRVSPGTALGSAFAVDYAEVRLPIAGRDLRFLDLPEMEDDPPVEVELRDAIDRTNPTTWTARIVRTEGTLDQDSLELFAIARIEDPFGLQSAKPPLRIGQPVSASITGSTLTNVFAMPRKAVRQLNQVFLIDPSALTLKSITIEPVWSDEDQVIVQDSSLADGSLLATTQLVYAPDGGKVEIIPDTETASSATPSEPVVTADSDEATTK